ncbi:hypothetical protein SCP_0101110 [Sparassis crispa]|uniref:Major facilitator superfamily (MFS) profile domain-containing protein n=1 Tax=Sparassis crispa TaxID=139825 RepID=A0A401G4X9_9APHY|nr:hypothetical protein SCP_0101110 [Sparassis crispa]GBE77238.1 hypothetical protein SCP_0101110 [Sparassis crispa]
MSISGSTAASEPPAGHPSTPTAASSVKTLSVEPSDSHVQFTKDFGFLPIPRRLRYEPEHSIHFGLLLNATFGLGGTFLQLSDSFNVTYDDVSRIPTLIQAGYAVGMLTISILGDLVRRRPLLLLLVVISASLTIGLAFTKSLITFEVLSFFIGAASITPQILVSLAADLAPPERRASALSIVLSGLLFGVLLARVIAGIITQSVSWRVVYYLAIGLQFGVALLLYLVLPDYPAHNKGATYFGILFSLARFLITEPLLVQATIINFLASACFSNFWVTLTFLLGGPPYNYSTLVIGLFGLVGMFGVAMAPVIGWLIDGLIAWFAAGIAVLAFLVFQAIAVGADGVNIAAIVIVCFGIDVFRQMIQVSLMSAVFGLDVNARSRLNAILIIAYLLGMVMGTSVGTRVFDEYGWRPSAALSLGWTGLMLFVMLLRGPHVPRRTWFGYMGGIEIRKKKLAVRAHRAEEGAATSEAVLREEMQEKGSSRMSIESEGEVTEKVRMAEGCMGSEVIQSDNDSAQMV